MELWDYNKRPNIGATGVTEGEARERRAEKVLK